jgi:hypothetical protein
VWRLAPRPSRSEQSSTGIFPNFATEKACGTNNPSGAREPSSYFVPFSGEGFFIPSPN